MFSLLTLLLTSFVLSFLLTPLVRNLALRWGWVDPPGGRKIHTDPIPRVGGIAIAVGYMAAFGLFFLLPLQGVRIPLAGLPFASRLMPAALAIFFTGLLDDLTGLKPWQKLTGEAAAAVLACWAGVQIHSLGGLSIAETWWHVPLTIFWLVGCMNAVNLIDGMDGLASGIGLFAAVTSLMAALLGSDMRLAFATAPLVGALLGFLRYNFNPASIFLGDCGSLLIGFLLGCYGVLWSEKAATVLAMTAPLMALAIPLLDTALSIARRFLKGRPIFQADRGHIHHRLLARGLTPRRAVILLYIMCGIGATFSLLQCQADGRFGGLIIGVFCGAAWIGIHQLDYVEFSVAGRMILPNTFRHVLSAQISIRQFEDLLKAARTMDECWDALEQASRELGFGRVQLHCNGETWRAWFGDLGPGDCWKFRVPLGEGARAEFAVPFGGRLQPMAVGAFANALRNSLAPRLPEILHHGHPLACIGD
jgi:UDP-GlcNAc:undecaprenyl-phosphate GlcNAc-1-phosphate transferase